MATPKIVELDPTTKSIKVPTDEQQLEHFQAEFKKPTPNLSKYKPEFMILALELANQGAGPVEIAKACGVSESTLYRWSNEKEDFKQCWEICQNLYKAWWEKLGRQASEGKVRGFNPYTYAFQMKNRFKFQGWSDSHDSRVSFGEEAPVDIDPNVGQLSSIRSLIDRKIK